MKKKASKRKLRIGFDIGGVISKYPDDFRFLISLLLKIKEVEVYIITDIPRKKAKALLLENKIPFNPKRLLCGNWKKHQDLCKTVLMKKHKIDIIIDDRLDYIMSGARIGLLVVPNQKLPYSSPAWKNF